MATETVRVSGARELRAALKRAGMECKDLTVVNRLVAQLVAHMASARSPRRSGRLAGSVRPGATTTAAIVRAGGAAIPYAGVIHNGWPAHHIEANPFIDKSAEATKPGWTALYLREMNQIIDRVADSTKGVGI